MLIFFKIILLFLCIFGIYVLISFGLMWLKEAKEDGFWRTASKSDKNLVVILFIAGVLTLVVLVAFVVCVVGGWL